jgi:hypothetical protein
MFGKCIGTFNQLKVEPNRTAQYKLDLA